MPTARKHQVNLDICRYYHCISRCVRRAFLCGQDQETGKNFDHRKEWLVDLMHDLAEIFAIKVCAYAVMSNHYHLVLYVDQEAALSWSNLEVVRRWASLFPYSEAQFYLEQKIDYENPSYDQLSSIQRWRTQLYDMSWFMRKLNEFIARQANEEDDCTGRFWEGRFKSQALLDESAILACMAYVDLNPIRAGISKTPETSDFTSIQRRIRDFKTKKKTASSMCIFSDESSRSNKKAHITHPPLPCTRLEYFELVDTTGRLIKKGKGAIPKNIAPILYRLGLKQDSWVQTIVSLAQDFASFMGRPESLERCMVLLDRPGMRGVKQARDIFNDQMSNHK